MPEGDVHLAGVDTHVSRKSFPFVLAGGAIVIFLVFRSRAATPPASMPDISGAVAAAQTASEQQNAELQSTLSQANYQLQALAASTAIEQQQLNQQYQLAAGINPGLQTQCIPISTWYNLGQDITRNLVQQVRDGQLYMSIGPQGVCFAPTQMGIQGHPPIVKNSTGLLSSSSSGYPGTVGTPGQPALVNILGQVLPYGY